MTFRTLPRFVFVGLTVACWSCSVETECPPGAERCPCAVENACDPGLECLSERCVSDVSGRGNTGGGSGSGAAGGSGSANGGTAGSAGETVARTRFCNGVQIDGMDATLRLMTEDQVFDAFTMTCSQCQDLPATVPLAFQVRLMPDNVVLSVFDATLEPGVHIMVASEDEDSGQGAIIDVRPPRPDLRCEDIETF